MTSSNPENFGQKIVFYKHQIVLKQATCSPHVAYFCFLKKLKTRIMGSNLTPFEGQNIRHAVHEGELWFSVSDIVGILSDSKDAKAYWRQLKKREPQLVTICHGLKLVASDGKMRVEDCSNREGVLRIIQSVPSPKAEPFKQWLAALGSRELAEMADPELLIERQAELYRAKGYSDEWIKNRIQTIVTRKELTDEWQKRGVIEGQEYSILTATIAKGTFGLSPSEHAQVKGLDKQNLRDHMTPLELIFTALGEEITRSEAVKHDAQGFNENHEVAQRGGQLAGEARQLIETRRNEQVVSATNFLHLKKEEKALESGEESEL
jgi:DNA-damage-inducible protein D